MRIKRFWRGREKRRALQISALALIAVLAVVLVAVGNFGILARLSLLVFDSYQQLKPRTAGEAPLVIVDIDEASIRQAGQWPWPRSDLARMVDRLTALGAAAIAFDLVFSEPDRTSLARAAESLRDAGAEVTLPGAVPDNDALLAVSFRNSRVIAGFVLTDDNSEAPPPPKSGFAFAGENPEAYLQSFNGSVSNLPVLSDAAVGAGYFSFPPSPDGVVREVPLVARSGGQTHPQLAIEALRVAQGAGSLVVRGTGSSGEAATGRAAMTALKVGTFEVPTGPRGEFRIYYSGLPFIPRISAAQLLQDGGASALADMVAGRIVLIGSSAIGLRDIVATPLAVAVPGVVVHAELIDQILAGAFLTRPDWALGAEIVAAVLFSAALVVALLSAGPVFGAFASIAIVAAAVATSWTAFDNAQLVLDPILPSVAVVSVYFVVSAFQLLVTDRERQFVRRAFSQYLAPALVERLAEDPAGLSLGGATRELTVLFSDLRGFTALSENLEPKELTRVLNLYLTPMTDILLQHRATIDKYVGDAIMAFWNAPLSIDEHPRRACLAALAMLGGLAELNRREGFSLRMGIGLNTGPCCVGNLGSEQRFSYSAIGDPVNVAARIEGLTKQYNIPILISDTTASQVGDLALLEIDTVRVVGRDQPLTVYAVIGDDAFAATTEFQALASRHAKVVAFYQVGDIDGCEAALREARALAPEQLSSYYEDYSGRLASLRENRPARWDGTVRATKK